ncbi:MAG: hypothetical protein ABSG22_02390 [Sedimentisphaerales bacterium]
MAKAINQDLKQKLRLRRILFTQGYWCPIEVELSQYEMLGITMKRSSLTDLDVLGVKYDKLFSTSKVVGDCKSGKNVSDANRLFWLKGIKDYFGADQAYLLRPIVNSHARAMAPKLGLRVIDDDTLDAMEKNLAIIDYPLPLVDEHIQEEIQAKWGVIIPKGQKPSEDQLQLKEVYAYLSYSYWYIEQNRNLLNILNHFSKVASLLTPKNEAHVLLSYIGLERFVHSLLETTSYILAQGTTNIPRDFRNYIYGGPLSLREKENFFQLLRKLTSSNEQLDPPYLSEVIELTGRIIRNPAGGAEIIRHIQAIYLWCVHLKNTALPPLDREKENTAAIVLSRDAAKIFTTITGLNSLLFSAIDSL